MSGSYNIPALSAGAAVDRLSALYIAALRADRLDLVPSAALWGPMGVGKSAAVRETAERVSAQTGRAVEVTDIRLLNFSPVDLRGVPAADKAREFTVWLRPKIFDLDPAKVHLLFLDEISAAPQSMQAAAYQIALDKRVGEFPLPKNCAVVCAGNRTTDQSVAFRMPKALANRLMHFEIRADFDSWYAWALGAGIHEMVLGYLAFDRSKLLSEAPGPEELAFPTPRSWEFVSRLLRLTGEEPEAIHDLVAGCVGVGAAVEFETWCRVYRDLPGLGEVLAGGRVPVPKGADARYALVCSLSAALTGPEDGPDAGKLENACRYVSGFQTDYAALFFRGLLRVEGMELRLMKCPSFLEWMRKNKRYL